MAYTSLTRQSSNLDKKGDATRDRSRDNTKGTGQYLVTYAYTNNNCLLCPSNIIVSVAIPTLASLGWTPLHLVKVFKHHGAVHKYFTLDGGGGPRRCDSL